MKSLNDILKGKKESKIVPASTGDDPGVDYAAVSKKERDLVAKHKVEKHEDRVGNETVPYKTTLSKAKFARHGKDTVAAGKATYEETEAAGEQLDELSKKTLGSYVKKAAYDARASAHYAAIAHKDGDDAERKENIKRGDKRVNGIVKATNRLTKEEVEQIDELSKKTLGNYINKAVDDNKNRKPGIALALKKRNGDPKVKATKDKKED